MRKETTAHFTSPEGEDFTITAFAEFRRELYGDDLDGNRGEYRWEIADAGYDVEPEAVEKYDQLITEHIGQTLEERLTQ